MRVRAIGAMALVAVVGSACRNGEAGGRGTESREEMAEVPKGERLETPPGERPATPLLRKHTQDPRMGELGQEGNAVPRSRGDQHTRPAKDSVNESH